jgi:broad specificity phosphatase PhoE
MLPTSPVHQRLYLVRHGEADWNASGRLCTRTDRPLTDRGRAQASALGARFGGIRFDAVVSSPLQRATETAELILAESGRADGPPIVLDDRLVEVDFGPFEGWTEEELAADPRGRAWRAGEVAAIEGMETDDQAAERAAAACDDLAAMSGATRILVVSHGYLIRVLLVSRFLGLPPSSARRLRVRNCRPAVVELADPPLLLGLNLEGPEALDEPHFV